MEQQTREEFEQEALVVTQVETKVEVEVKVEVEIEMDVQVKVEVKVEIGGQGKTGRRMCQEMPVVAK